jgi:hypothetical protein
MGSHQREMLRKYIHSILDRDLHVLISKDQVCLVIKFLKLLVYSSKTVSASSDETFVISLCCLVETEICGQHFYV